MESNLKPARRDYDEDAYYEDWRDRRMDAELEIERENQRLERERQEAVERQKSDPLWGAF